MATKTTQKTGGMAAALARVVASKVDVTERGTSMEERMRAADSMVTAAPSLPTHGSAASGFESTTARMAVSILMCKPHPLNARRFYPPDAEAEFARVIARDGQMDAAKAVPDPDTPGGWLIVDGVRRLRVLRRNGAETIDITPVDPSLTPLQIYQLSKSLNDARAEQTDLDNAFAWRGLIETKIVRDQQDLAEQLGMSTTTVSRIISLTELPESVIDVMRQAPDKFPYRLANELRLLAKEKDLDAAIEQATLVVTEEEGTVTVRSLEAMRLRAAAPSSGKRTRENPQSTIRLEISGQQAGALKVFASGRMLLDISGASPQLQSNLEAAIKGVLESGH